MKNKIVVRTKVECTHCGITDEIVFTSYTGFLNLNSAIINLDAEGFEINGIDILCPDCQN